MRKLLASLFALGKLRSRAVLLISAILLLSSVANTARAGFATVNGFGNGLVTVNVWCYPAAPPALPTYTAFGPNAATLGPNLPGCNPLTTISGTTAAFWQVNWKGVAGGGDIVDDSGLYPLVTPTSVVATVSADVTATILSSTTAEFDIHWFGSDEGTAAELSWYEGSTLLLDLFRVGPWDETISVTITSSGPIEDVELRSKVIATSVAVPEPSSLSLTCLGFFAGVVALRRRK